MELGEKIRAARLEAGLSQRQLCDGSITRNMLSQIENGTARPSMTTLHFLAARLGRPVSYFLDEQALVSPNQDCMAKARQALAQGNGQAVAEALAAYRPGDAIFDEEHALLRYLGYVSMARQALDEDRKPYALSLLEKADACQGIYITDDLRRTQHILMAKAGGPLLLENEDETLLLRAANAATPGEALALLGAVADKTTPQYRLLSGKACFDTGDMAAARAHLEQAEQTAQVLSLLEQCCAALGDFKSAYAYAKQTK